MNAKRLLIIVGIQAASFAAIILVWQYLYSANIIPHLFLTSPYLVGTHFLKVATNPQVVQGFSFTLRVIATAFAAALLVGAAIGLTVGEILNLKTVMVPYLILMNSIPRVMFIVLFWTLIGFGFMYEFSFAFFSGLFPVIINTLYAVETVDPNHIRLARSFGAGATQIQTKVMLPTVFPSILSASRLTFNLVIGGVIIAEEFTGGSGSSGIGSLTTKFSFTFQTVNLYTVVVMVALLSIAINLILLQLEKYITRWNVQRT